MNRISKQILKIAKELNRTALDKYGDDGSDLQSLIAPDNFEQNQLDAAEKQGKKYILKQKENGLWRIQACKNFGDVKKGDLGGLIQSEDNLSHKEYCWICVDARVIENAKVMGNAMVIDEAIVSENAVIRDNATIAEDAFVSGNAQVFDNAYVSGKAYISDMAMVFGDARVYDYAKIINKAKVYGHASVFDHAYALELAEIFGTAKVGGNIKMLYKIDNGYKII